MCHLSRRVFAALRARCALLDKPELEGIAAVRRTLSIIDTDPARFNSLDEGFKDRCVHLVGVRDQRTRGRRFRRGRPGGYLAPPLYGVWATAPYFHNGSVPNLWEVLKPIERKTSGVACRRPRRPAIHSTFMGFDASFARAYDTEKLGWKYDVVPCGDPILEPHLDCTPEKNNPGAQTWFAWNLSQPPLTEADFEKRKIYNTRKYSQSNQGHAFTTVLTDAERRR